MDVQETRGDEPATAKRERGSLLAALQEGRAASKSDADFDTCLDRYLDALEQGGAREKTVRGNRWVAKKYLRDRLGPNRCRRSPPTTSARCSCR